MSDPYARGLIAVNPYGRRRTLRGKVVAVMDLRLDERGLQLMTVPTRVVRKGEVHELIVTAESAAPGGCVERVAYLGFFEAANGSVLRRGDQLVVNGERVADLLGFDETHAPNHLNIVLRSDWPETGTELGWEPETDVSFVPAEGG